MGRRDPLRTRSLLPSLHRQRGRHAKRRSAAFVASFAVAATVLAPTVAPPASAADVGQGFTITTSDLAYILKQIKIAEAHVANTTSETGPWGPDRHRSEPDREPVGLGRAPDRRRLVQQPGAGQGAHRCGRRGVPAPGQPRVQGGRAHARGLRPPGPSSYAQKKGNVFDTEPRVVSNLVVDQTSTNPAAIAAAGFPVRTQGNPGVQPCTTDPDETVDPPIKAVPANCTPSHETLFIPNVTTDVGLSPPYNSMFTLFGQFFDHGIDQTVKGGGTVFVPLKGDDPLIAGPDHKAGTADDLPASQRFMVLTRGKNQPGPDGVLGTADDIQDALNTNSPWIDQSQTYTSHASHQVFLREYENDADGRPVSTGKLLGGTLPEGAPATQDAGMALGGHEGPGSRAAGLQLEDKDALSVPMLAVDPYGRFLPGPERGLPQYVTKGPDGKTNTADDVLVEGDTASPVRWNDVITFETPFLTDIAHNADPSPQDTDHNPGTPPVAPQPDEDDTASADFANQLAGTYDDEMLDAHFIAGDGRVNENIGLTAIHQVFHSEHDRVVDDIESILEGDTTAKGAAALADWKSTGPSDWGYGERLFQAARFVTEMEYQHLVREFARKIQPRSTPSSRSPSPSRTSTRQSGPSSPTRSTASATRC